MDLSDDKKKQIFSLIFLLFALAPAFFTVYDILFPDVPKFVDIRKPETIDGILNGPPSLYLCSNKTLTNDVYKYVMSSSRELSIPAFEVDCSIPYEGDRNLYKQYRLNYRSAPVIFFTGNGNVPVQIHTSASKQGILSFFKNQPLRTPGSIRIDNAEELKRCARTRQGCLAIYSSRTKDQVDEAKKQLLAAHGSIQIATLNAASLQFTTTNDALQQILTNALRRTKEFKEKTGEKASILIHLRPAPNSEDFVVAISHTGAADDGSISDIVERSQELVLVGAEAVRYLKSFKVDDDADIVDALLERDAELLRFKTAVVNPTEIQLLSVRK